MSQRTEPGVRFGNYVRYGACVSRDPASSQPDQPKADPSRPWGVVVGAVVLAVESLTLLAAAVYYIIGVGSQAAGSPGGGIFMIVLLLALTVGLGSVSMQFFRGYRWTRSAAFVWQLLMVALAVPTLLGGIILVGLVMLLPPLLLLVLLFTPRVVAYTLRGGGASVA